MTERTKFLKQETLSGKNKCMRAPLPPMSVADTKASIPERKALALKLMFDEMPLFIGERELIVGTRTFFTPHPDNADGHSKFDYTLNAYPQFLTEDEIKLFGGDFSQVNKQHYTPDLGILLRKGIDGIIADAENRKKDNGLKQHNIEFLNSVIIAYQGLSDLIERYSRYADELASNVESAEEKERLTEISRVCAKISHSKPETFREAVQLLWFGHLGTIIESFMFVCYGRLDVVLGEFLGDTSYDEAEELIECLLLKMYDQADINDLTYIFKHEGQLVVTLGGVLPNGENAVNDVTMMFLDAIENIKLPDPEFNLRISSKNPGKFLDKAASLTVKGYNFISYYNDDLFVESLASAGIPSEDAACYGFDLCQDIVIPGKNDSFCCSFIHLTETLMDVLRGKSDFASFEELYESYKNVLAQKIRRDIVDGCNREQVQMLCYRDGKYDEYFRNIKENNYPPTWNGKSPLCPLPYLSGLYHGTIENAADMTFESYPIQHKGAMFGSSVEAINSLAAIKKIVFEDKLYTLGEVVKACEEDYKGEGQEIMRNILWNTPKWGNDDSGVDLMAKDLLEFCLKELKKYRTLTGGGILGGIHQPHPVPTGAGIMATPEGRHKGAPIAVTLTPESGTMKNGPTAALKSAAVFDPMLIQWNFCVMINYYASVFDGKSGKDNFKKLLTTYFKNGGMQHQPNVLDKEILLDAQNHPEGHKDLIVRLWGVSAHFVDLPKEVQDEMISRLS